MALNASQPSNLTRTSPPATPAAPATNQPRSYTGQSTWQQPTYIDPSKSISNTLASGYQAADPRSSMKQLDKAGFSRGKGQEYRAAIASAQTLGDSRMNAANTQLEADKANAQMRTDFEFGQEQEAQKLARIQAEMENPAFSMQMAQQEALAKLYQTQLQGQQRVSAAYV